MVWSGELQHRRRRLVLLAVFIGVPFVCALGMLLWATMYPFLLLIIIRHNYNLSHPPRRPSYAHYGLQLNECNFTFCNSYQPCFSHFHCNPDKNVSKKLTNNRFGAQQSIYGAHGDLGWICSSHRFIRCSVPSAVLFCPISCIIHLHGMFDPYKCTCHLLLGWEKRQSYVSL